MPIAEDIAEIMDEAAAVLESMEGQFRRAMIDELGGFAGMMRHGDLSVTRRSLWVVGGSSPDPTMWSSWSEWVLVVARDEGEARKVAERPTAPCCRLPLDAPAALYQCPEPRQGADI